MFTGVEGKRPLSYKRHFEYDMYQLMNMNIYILPNFYQFSIKLILLFLLVVCISEGGEILIAIRYLISNKNPSLSSSGVLPPELVMGSQCDINVRNVKYVVKNVCYLFKIDDVH